MSEGDTDPSGAKLSALGRGLTIVESVLEYSRLSDIANATGLSNSTVHRILADLTAYGWVFQDETRQYHPGRRLHALAARLADDGHLVGVALPHLERLREATGHTVHFGLIKSDRIMYAAKLDGNGAYRMRSRVGAMVPLHSTAIGKAVLSTKTREQVEQLLSSAQMEPMTPSTYTSVESLLPELDTSRARGWAIDDKENEPQLRCVGAAVLNGNGQAIGGVSVSALDFDLPIGVMAEVAAAVSATAAAISSELGSPLD